jgi:hypothetical protein
MGRKHRESRKSVKSRLLQLGLKENEFGELTKRVSKAEARRVLLGRRLAYFARVRECVDLASKRATEDVQAIEDAIAIDNLEKIFIVVDVMLT